MDELNYLAGLALKLSAVIWLVMWLILNLLLALAVSADVDELREKGREPQMFGAVGWSFVVLVTSLFGLALYWVMHHSSLRDPASDRSSSQS